MTEVENKLGNLSDEAGYTELMALKAIRGCKADRDALLNELKITEICINMETILCLGSEDSERLNHLRNEKSLLRRGILILSEVTS